MDGKQLQTQYKDHLSDFNNWNQKEHAEDFILYPKNIGYHLCIDETALSKGELYTILTNRDKHGRKGTIVAIVKGTKAEDVINVLLKIDAGKRNQVKEITLDMAGSMQKIARRCFPGAMQVVDRFHVSKLVYEAVQDLRIAYRWQVMKDGNRKIKEAKAKGESYEPEVFSNGDTLRQLLARSRYLLFKAPDKWLQSQKTRAQILFEQFPALWYNEIEEFGYDTFTTVANSIGNHYERILNYFVNRSTNAAAEAFNAKIKAFRASFRGVVDKRFFLYRLAKVYA